MRLHVPILRALCDPTLVSPWGCYEPVTQDLIDKCLKDRLLKVEPVHHEEYEDPIAHAQRIAFFMEYGWQGSIQVDIGVPDLGCHVRWPITDGNHRFSAAIFLGRPWIEGDLAGSVDYAEDLRLVADWPVRSRR